MSDFTQPTGIYPAMANVLKSVGHIGKDKKNRSQGFQFRGIDDIYNAVHQLLAANDIFCLVNVISSDTEVRQTKSGSQLFVKHLTTEFKFVHADGSSVSSTIPSEGMDSGDKGTNKAISVGHKYAFLTAFAIPTEEMLDGDETTHEETVNPVSAFRAYYKTVKSTLKGATSLQQLNEIHDGHKQSVADKATELGIGSDVFGKCMEDFSATYVEVASKFEESKQ